MSDHPARRPNLPIVSVLESSAPPAIPSRTLADFMFGRRLSGDEEEHEHIGSLTGVAVLGLDALSSAAYGPDLRWSFSNRRRTVGDNDGRSGAPPSRARAFSAMLAAAEG